jgi:murein L,D-transpeptidase YcbB/YkuD
MSVVRVRAKVPGVLSVVAVRRLLALAPARVIVLCLLLGAGPATADLAATLSPFVGTDDAPAEPPTLALADGQTEPYSPRLLAELYAERDYRPAWDDRRARTMLALARQSRADGFLPADFHAEAIEAVLATDALAATDASRRTSAELLLSDALLRYIHHFRFGKHNPRHVNPDWTFVEPADAERLKADMAHVLATPGMAEELAAMLPSPAFYRNLKKGYRRYLAIADRGGWKDVPGGPNLRVGARDPRVPLIREHLEVIDGFDPGGVAAPEVYDEDLAQAVKGFQRRSGLAADGIVGPNTLRALNVPLDERLLTIRANLERMRWLYDDLPADYLFVDLAAFELYLVRDHEEAWRTRGVIGTVEDQTPMFRDEMEYLVFNPTWTVPRSIEKKKFKGVPDGYKRVRSGGQYYLVQEPGPRNALGRVKFMFPNGHAIYLHDTPSRYLFKRSRRTYSHGCVRVHDPLTLAERVLDAPVWSRANIDRVVRRGSTRWVHLDEFLPVLLYYLSAKADAAGRVGFRRDIYDRDQRLLAMLDEPVSGAERIAFTEPQPTPQPASEPAPEPAAVAVAAAAAGEAAADADTGSGPTATEEAVGSRGDADIAGIAPSREDDAEAGAMPDVREPSPAAAAEPAAAAQPQSESAHEADTGNASAAVGATPAPSSSERDGAPIRQPGHTPPATLRLDGTGRFADQIVRDRPALRPAPSEAAPRPERVRLDAWEHVPALRVSPPGRSERRPSALMEDQDASPLAVPRIADELSFPVLRTD